MFEVYGKSSKEVMGVKSDYIERNDEFLATNDGVTKKYSKLPMRERCMICETQILPKKKVEFYTHGMTYFICPICGHVNGIHAESFEFIQELYETEGSEEYAKDITDRTHNKFIQRVEAMYEPKADFIINSLSRLDINAKELSFLDIGSGAGHFVYAMAQKNLKIIGIEVSSVEASYANKRFGKEMIKVIPSENVTDFIQHTPCQFLSYINVLEHVYNPVEFFRVMHENPNVRYAFISVPTFSLSCFLEAANQECYNRQLGGYHTHLYTMDSLKYLCSNYGFQIKAKWNFGSDMIDLYRMLSVKLKLNKQPDSFCDLFHNRFLNILDALQLVLDKNDFCADANILIEKM